MNILKQSIKIRKVKKLKEEIVIALMLQLKADGSLINTEFMQNLKSLPYLKKLNKLLGRHKKLIQNRDILDEKEENSFFKTPPNHNFIVDKTRVNSEINITEKKIFKMFETN